MPRILSRAFLRGGTTIKTGIAVSPEPIRIRLRLCLRAQSELILENLNYKFRGGLFMLMDFWFDGQGLNR
jgi:hypothetical protein